MQIDVLLKIAGVGLLIAIICQALTQAGRQDIATLATVAEGKRPRYTAMAERGLGDGARITSAGEVQVSGAISAGESITVLSTYILA